MTDILTKIVAPAIVLTVLFTALTWLLHIAFPEAFP
jgi:hypothetical protein